jgi:hopanoid biosynthesis associated protein HpnK
MGSLDGRVRLIVNADDFGQSSGVNEAVIRAHRQGILTSASLMINGEASEQAVEWARENPGLGIGLHLTLVCGGSTLTPGQIPGLVNADCRFSDKAVWSGLRYYFLPALRTQLAREIEAQVEKFLDTGLRLDHLNAHLNLQMHPVILRLILDRAGNWGVRHIRLTRDPFLLNRQIAAGRWGYRVAHGLIFHWLGRQCERALSRHRIGFADQVFGLLQNGRVDEPYVLRLLSQLRPGTYELYSHPATDTGQTEFQALISPRVRDRIDQLGVDRVRYQDL